jgi:BolA family transcriptional regulator, general stress-responsive regulator
MKNEERLRAIEYLLIKALHPEKLTVDDDSAQHAGHAGAASGAGHFSVSIVSASFEDKSLIKRHRLVYDAIDSLMDSDIHALKINAKAPSEVNT